MRRLIVDEMAVNPKYYEKMSAVLDALIRRRREEAVEYEDYLKKVIELAEKVKRGEDGGSSPASIGTRALRAIYDNLPEGVLETKVAEGRGGEESDGAVDPREVTALAVDSAVRQARMADWRDHPIKEKRIKAAIQDALGPYKALTFTIFEIVKAQGEY